MAASLQRCEVCGKYAQHKHHIFTRGAHKSRALVSENEIHLCAPCHSAWHTEGRDTFAEAHGLIERVRAAEEAVRGI
jgi:hypothetical protein